MPQELMILLIIIAIAAVIAIVAFVIHRFLNPKMKQEDVDESKFVQEELDRVLKPIEDDETARQVNEYKDEDEEN